jgi:UDP-GlcNAc3NAcA epimerase
MQKIIAIIGARPQFIKHAPFELACKGRVELVTIHTGQHYDDAMSKVFFDEMGMRQPDYHLPDGQSVDEMEPVIYGLLKAERPDCVVVYGDTFSTLAGARAAKRAEIMLAHVEAGLRSGNLDMPEERIRIEVDALSRWLFVPTYLAELNLINMGIEDSIYIVGDIMRDAIKLFSKQVPKKRPYSFPYYYATLHRPYNVDDGERLARIFAALNTLEKKVVLALHPRTKRRCTEFGIQLQDYPRIIVIEPQPYLQNLGLMKHSHAIITDSGGMQKEAYWLKRKCVTLRSETEWPETLFLNANTLVFENLEDIYKALKIDNRKWFRGLYGTGHTAQKILDIILK